MYESPYPPASNGMGFVRCAHRTPEQKEKGPEAEESLGKYDF